MPRLRTLIAPVCAALCAVPGPALGDGNGNGGTAYGDTAATLDAQETVILGRRAHFSGTLPGAAGQTIVIQRREHEAAWEPAATAVADAAGAFEAVWRTDHIGRFDVRAVVAGQEPATADAKAAAAIPTRAVTVFKAAVATWYGPGFYGHRTACGQRMSRRLLGAAHRSLPCGTPVALLYKGRTITVPVVDRGPFSATASYDLTAATAKALGMSATSTIGAVAFRPVD